MNIRVNITQNNIKAVVINTQCVKNKVSEFHCMLDEHNPDIVMVTETWLDLDWR